MAKVTGWTAAAEAMNARYPAPSAADAEWADAIVFGTPTRFGSVSSELKTYLDGLGGLWVQGKLNGKAGAVFCSTSTPNGGNESTLLSMYNPLAHLGFIIAPTGYADASLYKAGTPYGASSVSNNQATPPSADDLDVARFQGRRVTDVARALKHSGVK
jgi:NAD(P)H dehydrogenase (quinone)